MQSQTLALGIAAAAVLFAAVLVLVTRPTSEAPPPVAPAEAGAETPRVVPAASEAPRDAAAPATEPAAAKIRELEAMSESFRNSTFLIAIRDAGFVCNELLRVSGGWDGGAKWLATCSETIAYTIGVANDGALRVEPLLQYFDGIMPRVIDRDLEPSPQPLPQR